MPTSSEPEQPAEAPFMLEPTVAEACRSALSPALSLPEMIKSAQTVVRSAKALHKERTCFGASRPVPAALLEQIDTVRDWVVQKAIDPAQPVMIAIRLYGLIIALSDAAHRIRRAQRSSAPRPSAIVPTHPTTISRWVH